eukprot:COSAG04_NODE_19386_length_417_cov_1.267296_1_plen_99_part_01
MRASAVRRLLRAPRCRHTARRPLSSKASEQRTVVVTSRAFPETLDMLRSSGLHVVANDGAEPWPAEVLAAHAADAHALMCFMPDTVDRAVLDSCPRLEI